MDNERIFKGLAWKMMERLATLGGQFIVQIILARLLGPSEYGALAIMMVFISVAQIFVQNGFNTSLIQNRTINEDDYSSVLWVSEIIAFILYWVVFVLSPIIASVYKMNNIVWPLRILALILFSGAFNSVQIAKVTREMKFKIIFRSNAIAVAIAGLGGILAAYNGMGLWALVIQSLINSVSVCIVMLFTANIHIKFFISIQRVKILFAFGWKLVVSSLLNNLTENIRGLTIGFKYDASALGFYNRGMQFPQYGITVIQSTLQSVMLPALSEQQDDKAKAKVIMKNTIILSSYVVFPLMAGLAAVSASFVRLLLTDTWIGCVPYMRIYCLIFAFFPMYVCNLQAMNAMGRSDIYLKLEIVKQAYSLIALIITIVFFETPMSIAISSASLIPLGIFCNCFPNKKLIGYGVVEQLQDMIPSISISLVMFFIVWNIERMSAGLFLTFFVQVIVGIGSYIFLSALFRVRPYMMIFRRIQSILRGHKDG